MGVIRVYYIYIVVRYQRFRRISSLLVRKGRGLNFTSRSQKHTYRQTDGQTKFILFVTVEYLYIHTSVYLIYPVQEHRKFSQKQDKEEDKKTQIFRSSIKVLLKISKNPSCTQFSSKQAL